MSSYSYYEYLKINGNRLFTMILLPEKDNKFPVVICRSPYVSNAVGKPDDEVLQDCLQAYEKWLDRGYAIIFQHCRGRGKSAGGFVPYIYEREDGLLLRQWIREQAFYNGELFLMGGSYTASLHYETAPFEEDILGAVFEVQDSERYNLWYRNGQMRKGHANWHFELYKSSVGSKKDFNFSSFDELPLKDLSERALGERSDDFEQMLRAQFPTDKFWDTRYGGTHTKNSVMNANIPILLTTGYNDFYVGGIFKMWNLMDDKTKSKSSLIVSPYNHGDGYYNDQGLIFPNGARGEQFGETYQIDWFDNIRKGTALPYQKGVITYYRAFENRWDSDFYKQTAKLVEVCLGDETRSFNYDPYNPTSFSCEGTFSKEVALTADFIRVYTKSFDRDVFVKGQMRASLTVSSNCEDTSFYIRISIKSSKYSYVLRHDITSLCYQLGEYVSNEVVTLDFCFDEYAFLLKKGECLQIDIAATDNNTYISHTNKKGDYYLQTDAEKAINTVYLGQSRLFLPIEE